MSSAPRGFARETHRSTSGVTDDVSMTSRRSPTNSRMEPNDEMFADKFTSSASTGYGQRHRRPLADNTYGTYAFDAGKQDDVISTVQQQQQRRPHVQRQKINRSYLASGDAFQTANNASTAAAVSERDPVSLQRFADSRVQPPAERYFHRRMSDQFSPTAENNNNNSNGKFGYGLLDKFATKDDDPQLAGSAGSDLTQPSLYRSKPYQDITSLGEAPPTSRWLAGSDAVDCDDNRPRAFVRVLKEDSSRNANEMDRGRGFEQSRPGLGFERNGSGSRPSNGCAAEPMMASARNTKRVLPAVPGGVLDNCCSFPRITIGDSGSCHSSDNRSEDSVSSGTPRRSGIPVLAQRRCASATKEMERQYDSIDSYMQTPNFSTPAAAGFNGNGNSDRGNRNVPGSQPAGQRLRISSAGGENFTPVSRPRSANPTSQMNRPHTAREMREHRQASGAAATRTSVRPTAATALVRPSPRTPSGSGTATLLGDRGRSSIPKKSSVSQPGSRSTSPSSRLDYITYRQPEESTPRVARPSSAAGNGPSSSRSSRIPRSRGHSRETSPVRSTTTHEMLFRPVGGPPGMPQPREGSGPGRSGPLALQQLQRTADMEAAVNDALLLRGRVPADAGRRDDNSETSSVSSESCSRSLNAVAMDVSDIIAHISSGVWSDRRDGLFALLMFLKNDGLLSSADAKKMTELFTRMFHDPSPKVYGIFLETLPQFVRTHAADVTPDWLYICVSRLIGRLASEQLSSVLGKVSKSLKAVREEFPVEDQLNALSRFICESTKMNDAKTRTVFLEYLHDLAVSMDSSELSNSDSIRQLAIRIIAWTSEPKCTNIRRLSQNVVIALFNVNTPEFYTILNALPRSIRDAGCEILQNHLASVTQQDSGPTPPPTDEFGRSTHLRPSSDFSRSSRDEADEDRMSTEEFYASLKKTSEDIQNLSRMDSPPFL